MAKILIVEDYSVLARMYQNKFIEDGHQVEAALNGEEGLEKVKTFKPDLILLDIMMPKMSGLELLKILKEDPTLKHTPVVMLTNVSGEVVEQGLELGAIAYLVKAEYSPKQVVGFVEDALAAYSQRIPEVKEAAELVQKREKEEVEKAAKTEEAEREVLAADARLDQAQRRLEEMHNKLEVLRKATTPREAMEIMEEENRRAEIEFEQASQQAQRVAKKIEGTST